MGGCMGKKHNDDEEKLDFKGGNVHIIKSKEDWDQKIAEANKDGKIVVANFSASWCGPCRVIAPVYTEMSQTYPQFMFLTVDVDDLMDFSSSWDIRATPTFFSSRTGSKSTSSSGPTNLSLRRKWLRLQMASEASDITGWKTVNLFSMACGSVPFYLCAYVLASKIFQCIVSWWGYRVFVDAVVCHFATVVADFSTCMLRSNRHYEFINCIIDQK